MLKINVILVAVFFGLLTACAPIYQTQYSYQPPASQMGQMCAAQCVQSKTMCQQMCQMRIDNCRLTARQNAQYEYQLYLQHQQASGKKVKKSPENFDNGWQCDQACDCESAFNTCYQACGGKVNTAQVCTAFCNQ